MNHEFEKMIYGRDKGPVSKYEEQFGIPHRELCSVEDLKVFVQVGKEMEIGVKVLAQAGEKYTTDYSAIHEDSSGMPVGASVDFVQHIVPDGSVYIEIVNEIRKMGEFYTKVDGLSEQAKVLPKANHR